MAQYIADAVTITETHADGSETTEVGGVWTFDSADDLAAFFDAIIDDENED